MISILRGAEMCPASHATGRQWCAGPLTTSLAIQALTW